LDCTIELYQELGIDFFKYPSNILLNKNPLKRYWALWFKNELRRNPLNSIFTQNTE